MFTLAHMKNHVEQTKLGQRVGPSCTAAFAESVLSRYPSSGETHAARWTVLAPT